MLFRSNWLNFGFVNIRKLWLSDAYNLGKIIEFNLKNNQIKGTFEGLDNSGNIIIKYNNNVKNSHDNLDNF